MPSEILKEEITRPVVDNELGSISIKGLIQDAETAQNNGGNEEPAQPESTIKNIEQGRATYLGGPGTRSGHTLGLIALGFSRVR